MVGEKQGRLALNLKETGARLGLSEPKVRGLLREGRLRHVRVGRRVLISERAIEAFLAGAA